MIFSGFHYLNQWCYLPRNVEKKIDVDTRNNQQWKQFFFEMPYSECRTKQMRFHITHYIYTYLVFTHLKHFFDSISMYVLVFHWFQEMSWSFNSLFLGIIFCETIDWYIRQLPNDLHSHSCICYKRVTILPKNIHRLILPLWALFKLFPPQTIQRQILLYAFPKMLWIVKTFTCYSIPRHSLKKMAALIMTLTSFSGLANGWLSSYTFILTVLPKALP